MNDNMVLQYAHIDELYLDPLNPRVGRHNLGPDVTQDEILGMVEEWSLEELAFSFLENGGFWQHEALLVIEEKLYGEMRLVVVEGNRRLAALKFLHSAYNDSPLSNLWSNIASSSDQPDGLFSRIPYFQLDTREDVQAFLGFRHVTGIKQWDADEKAYFIAMMIDDKNMTYEQVMRMIGSTTPSVRRLYLAYRVLLQIEDSVDDYDEERAEDSFAILYMTLDTQGSRHYLNIDIQAEPPISRPVPLSRQDNLKNFAKWLYGSSKTQPIITDTRDASKFGKVLENSEAVDYLVRTTQPNIDRAYQLAGGEEEDVIRMLQQASDKVKDSLPYVYDYKDSGAIQSSVKQVGTDALAILNMFQVIRKELLEQVCEEMS